VRELKSAFPIFIYWSVSSVVWLIVNGCSPSPNIIEKSHAEQTSQMEELLEETVAYKCTFLYISLSKIESGSPMKTRELMIRKIIDEIRKHAYSFRSLESISPKDWQDFKNGCRRLELKIKSDSIPFDSYSIKASKDMQGYFKREALLWEFRILHRIELNLGCIGSIKYLNASRFKYDSIQKAYMFQFHSKYENGKEFLSIDSIYNIEIQQSIPIPKLESPRWNLVFDSLPEGNYKLFGQYHSIWNKSESNFTPIETEFHVPLKADEDIFNYYPPIN